MTQHDSLCLGLTHLGVSPLAAKGKYTVFRLGERYYFVGRAGALRVGFRPSPASSRPCHDVFRQRVLDAPAKALAQELEEIAMTTRYPILRCRVCGYEYIPEMHGWAFKTNAQILCQGMPDPQEEPRSRESYRHPFEPVEEPEQL